MSETSAMGARLSTLSPTEKDALICTKHALRLALDARPAP